MAENRGGRRQGRRGAAYPNRTDLNTQPIRTSPSTSYGEAAASARSQAAAPLPQTPGVPTQLQSLMAPPQGEPPANPLMRASERPGEPVQAGLGASTTPDDFDLLMAVFEQMPNAGMTELFDALGYKH